MKIFKFINRKEALIIGMTLAAGLILGAVFFGGSKDNPNGDIHEGHNHGEVAGHEEITGNAEIANNAETIYTCSMHPQIKQNGPGLCPICAMELVPLTTIIPDGEDVDPNEIQMTESAIKLADIQTTIVSLGIPVKTLHLLGKVQADERNIAQLTARFGGRIENLDVNFTGQNVKRGQKLGTIYSPELITAQKELLEAVKFRETNPSFYNASRSKLKRWDLTDEQINDLENNGEPKIYFEILSPVSGTVTKRHIALGDYVKEGAALYEVIDLTKVWIMFDAYERDLTWITPGDKVTFTLQSVPGKTYTGTVAYIDPIIDADTRVAKVRVGIPNPDLALKPEMFATGTLESGIAEKSTELLIPKSSILWTGKRSVVYVKIPDRETPSFLYREIVLGPEASGFYVVLEGLSEGEEIATNGVFKIDASAQLAGKISMMNPKQKKSDLPATSKVAQAPEAFKKQLTEVLNTYIIMKDAFVESDATDVTAKSKIVMDALTRADMGLLSGEAHKSWMDILTPLKSNLDGIIQMEGMEMKRSHFTIVSDKLIEAVKLFGITSDKTVYLDFCPMANDDKGGYWLSLTEEIKNPYFGDMMLSCGEVTEIIKK